MVLKIIKSVATPIAYGMLLRKDDGIEKVDVTIYRIMVGILIFLTNTRQYIACVISLISRYMSNPYESYMIEMKRIHRYAKVTLDFGIHYYKNDYIDE